MRQMAFAVYDTKMQAFLQPFFCANVPVAIRAFSAAVNDPETNLYRWPTDYTLFQVGLYDDSTGEFENTMHVNLGLAANFKTRPVVGDMRQSDFREAVASQRREEIAAKSDLVQPGEE